MKSNFDKGKRLNRYNSFPERGETNRGGIFYQNNHFLYYSGFINTPSEFFLKIERLIRDTPDITSDGQFYRILRSGQINEKILYSYFSKLTNAETAESALVTANEHSDFDGGWSTLSTFLKGLLRSGGYKDLEQYIHFVIELCNIDRSIIREADEKLVDLTMPIKNRSVREWLAISQVDIDNSAKIKEDCYYLISSVLHLTALFEHFLRFQHPALSNDKEGPFSLNGYMPALNKNGSMKYSLEIFVEKIKAGWAKDKYSKSNITWVNFYRDIADARDLDMSNSSQDKDQDNVYVTDPDTIKKEVLRWRNGKLKISIESFLRNIGALYSPHQPPSQYGSTLLIIPLIQLIDNIQRELSSEGVSDSEIKKQFDRYSSYSDLVGRRFKVFCETNVIEP